MNTRLKSRSPQPYTLPSPFATKFPTSNNHANPRLLKRQSKSSHKKFTHPQSLQEYAPLLAFRVSALQPSDKISSAPINTFQAKHHHSRTRARIGHDRFPCRFQTWIPSQVAEMVRRGGRFHQSRFDEREKDKTYEEYRKYHHLVSNYYLKSRS
ncbi:hypothetical protein BDZ45DRAFT_337711 [Acephala macrosclerotiorum]|nr:hypothetical protein BDZ45DRAFT_337711 [Acephala macrosclerotiorum]